MGLTVATTEMFQSVTPLWCEYAFVLLPSFSVHASSHCLQQLLIQ